MLANPEVAKKCVDKCKALCAKISNGAGSVDVPMEPVPKPSTTRKAEEAGLTQSFVPFVASEHAEL